MRAPGRAHHLYAGFPMMLLIFRRFRSVVAAFLACCVVAEPAVAVEPAVVVSTKSAHALAAALLRGVAIPKLLVDGRSSPHAYAMKPSDSRALNGAVLFIRISERLEPFTAKVVSSLPQSVSVLTLIEAPGLSLLPARPAGVLDGLPDQDADGDHDHHHDTPGPGATDPHIWLDPVNAQMMAAAMTPALIRVYPASAGAIGANATALRVALGDLDAEIAAILKPAAGKHYLALHDAYQYLEHRYGLVAAGTVAVTPEAQAGARRLSELRSLIGQIGISCVFAEPVGEQRLVQSLAEGTGARVVRLDPEGLLLDPGPDFYAVLMRTLARDVARCFASTGRPD
jgi:zinc transport system substrate-binding protein